MRKQMEGDNRERRARARQARRRGSSPSAERATTGSSKQREHLRRSEDHDTKLENLGSGKQGGAAQAGRPKGRPHGGLG